MLAERADGDGLGEEQQQRRERHASTPKERDRANRPAQHHGQGQHKLEQLAQARDAIDASGN